MLRTHSSRLTVETPRRGTFEITDRLVAAVTASGIQRGTATVWIHHTSASLIVCENADPTVRRDLEAWMARAVRDGDPAFEHDSEGPDDMPAHVRSVLTQVSLTIPIDGGQLTLGTWQGVYVWEHRTAPHRRNITISMIGE